MERGVLYVVGEHELFREATQSARSIRQHSDLPIAVITDRQKEKCPSIFDEVIDTTDTNPDSSDKVKNISKTPFDQTLFLDTDTFITSDVSPLFDLLQNYDMAVSHAPTRIYGEVDVPKTFSEFNTGVIALADRPVVTDFIVKWEEYYKKLEFKTDQQAFRKALYESEVNHHVLTPEWNCRSIFPGYLQEEAIIIHGRHKNMAAIEQALNTNNTKRVHYPTPDGGVEVKTADRDRIRERIFRSVKYRGFVETLKKGAGRIAKGNW